MYERAGTATDASAKVYLTYGEGSSAGKCEVSVASVLSEVRGNRIWCKLERGVFSDGANISQAFFTLYAVEASSDDSTPAPTAGW